MVEAGGVEPPSENIPLQVLRAQPSFCFRAGGLPKAGCRSAILFKISPRPRQEKGFGYPAWSTPSSGPAGESGEDVSRS